MDDRQELNFRQGEIIIRKMNNANSWTERSFRRAKKLKTAVIREGETSGHMHAITAGELLQDGNNGAMFLKAVSGTTITHPEHGTLNIPAGNYEIYIQREYDPVGNRQVLD